MKAGAASQGFSLIEVVVVIAIAAILLAMAIPVFTDSESRATAFRDQVRAGLRYAQRQAVAQRRCVFVSVTASQVELLYGNSACVVTVTPVLDLVTDSAYVLAAPNGVTITPPTPSQFSFNGLGQPSAAVAIGVGGVDITVQPETGYVQ